MNLLNLIEQLLRQLLAFTGAAVTYALTWVGVELLGPRPETGEPEEMIVAIFTILVAIGLAYGLYLLLSKKLGKEFFRNSPWWAWLIPVAVGIYACLAGIAIPVIWPLIQKALRIP